MAQRGAEGVGGQVLYVCGPMSGYPEHNYPAFHAAEKRLAAAGYGVLSPARDSGWQPGMPVGDWAGYLRVALRRLLDADAVAVLPGWAESAGASLEVHVAHVLRMPVRPVEAWA